MNSLETQARRGRAEERRNSPRPGSGRGQEEAEPQEAQSDRTSKAQISSLPDGHTVKLTQPTASQGPLTSDL